MKKLNSILIVLFILQGTFLYSQIATVVLHVSDAKTLINKNIYGHFAEHLGRCIYDGLYIEICQVIPNTDGVRNDIIAALRKLKVRYFAGRVVVLPGYIPLERRGWAQEGKTRNDQQNGGVVLQRTIVLEHMIF